MATPNTKAYQRLAHCPRLQLSKSSSPATQPPLSLPPKTQNRECAKTTSTSTNPLTELPDNPSALVVLVPLKHQQQHPAE
jgi:hypothetical protein